ncbi:hypothetical protein D5278_04785 [bacterium 1XD21-13]|nr:hypothetical protein [bacterium 1XD21-13]
MKHKTYGFQIFILLFAAFPFWLPLVLWMGSQLMGQICGRDTAGTYERSWGIEISSQWQEVYYADSGASFHGDGEWYSIYENVSEVSIAELQIPFIKGKSDTMVEGLQFVTEALETESQNQPDLTGNFAWARLSKEDGSYLIFLFYPEEGRLYLAQAII